MIGHVLIKALVLWVSVFSATVTAVMIAVWLGFLPKFDDPNICQ